jgi:hypothetical protein
VSFADRMGRQIVGLDRPGAFARGSASP